MDHVAATVLLAQGIVRGLDVEQRDLPGAAGIGKRQQSVSRKIGQNQPDTAVRQSGKDTHRVVVGAYRRIGKLELLVHKATGGIVVAHGELGARQPIVRR